MNSKNKKIFMGIVILVIIALSSGFILINRTSQEKEASLIKMNNQIEIITERNKILKDAETLFQGYYYTEAIEKLKNAKPLLSFSENELNYFDQSLTYDTEKVSTKKFESKIKEIENAKDGLVKYKGPVHHIFFHSLIVYPTLAFDNIGRSANGYNMWMVTVSEFKKMLPLLLDKGYILYNLSDFIEMDPNNKEKIRQRDIMVLKGKTPLVISIDDVNYYNYMKPDGFAKRLVGLNDGKIYTEVVSIDGGESLTRDGDVMPILDDFVAEHPDFSFRGAKGTIALTGFEGALGYDFMKENDPVKKSQLILKAKKAADTLKKNGWLFACHSFTHNQYFRDGSMTLKKMKYDLDKWILNLEPIIGKTNIYISPFGVRYKNEDPLYRYIVANGFNIFCPVGNSRKIYFNGDNIVMDRVNIDGFSMNKRKDELIKYYFNVDEVYDSKRPELIY